MSEAKFDKSFLKSFMKGNSYEHIGESQVG